MKNFILKLLDLIYKKHCYFCKNSSENQRMCDNCYKNIKFLDLNTKKIIENSKVYCATFYNDNIKKMVRAVKYHNEKDLIYFQAKLMHDYWKKLCINEQDFVVIPVPMHKKREKKRKYNHMNLVAKEFAEMMGYEINTNLVKRIKDTKPQYKLSLKEREENLKQAFELSNNYETFKNKKILILDDILTTGSTLQEMIKTFHKKGIYDITCFTTSCSEYYNI